MWAQRIRTWDIVLGPGETIELPLEETTRLRETGAILMPGEIQTLEADVLPVLGQFFGG